ncbi:hypothetical protein BSL78_11749, partial [Apostichopus japonicus]
MANQISSVIKSCNFHLRNIGKVRKYLTTEACKTAVQSLVVSRMDYCCSLLTGVPAHQIRRLQVVQNRAARIIARVSPPDHISPVLANLHWIPCDYRVRFRILTFVSTAFTSRHRPTYVTSSLSTNRVAHFVHHLTSLFWRRNLPARELETMPSVTLLLNCGTNSRTILRTFFQTNMNSHSVGTPELGPDERQLNFAIKDAASGVMILSESSSLSGAHYEIEIGAESNMKSIIKYGGSILVEVDTIDILDSDNYVEFWISFRSGAIRVGIVGSLEFMSWQGSLPEIRFAFFKIGIHSASNIYYWFVFKYYYFSQAR